MLVHYRTPNFWVAGAAKGSTVYLEESFKKPAIEMGRLYLLGTTPYDLLSVLDFPCEGTESSRRRIGRAITPRGARSVFETQYEIWLSKVLVVGHRVIALVQQKDSFLEEFRKSGPRIKYARSNWM